MDYIAENPKCSNNSLISLTPSEIINLNCINSILELWHFLEF